MKVLGLVGWSGSGKTTLLTALLPIFRARGLSVSTVKHAHHGFDMDHPGKDSYRHRAAGAAEVLVMGGSRWALLHEMAGPPPPFESLLERLAPVDLVLIEGFKSHPYPKLEVYRPALGKPPIWPEQSGILAVATDGEAPGAPMTLPLDDPSAVADWALHLLAKLEDYAAVLEPGRP